MAWRHFLPVIFIIIIIIALVPPGAAQPRRDTLGKEEPAQDTCQTCHLSGEETSPWLPPVRWLVFGAVGVIFTAGIWRSAHLWTRRSQWRGPWTRLVDYLDREYGILAPARTKPVPLWPPRWWWTCLGGLSVLALCIQAVTGIMLAFYYKPVADINPATGTSYAYESIRFIMNEVQFGGLVRTIHHWTANLTIILVFLHMARVFVNRAYRAPRGSSWRWGVGLLILTVGFGFTGYLLPWDQNAFWATTVGSDIAGNLPIIGKPMLLFLRDGWTVTGQTLQRFYGLHVFALPVLTAALLALHLRKRRFWANIAPRQLRQWWMVLVLVVVGGVVLAVTAPLILAPPAAPFDPPDSPQPAWYFLFIYQFLKYVPGTVVIGGTPVITFGPVCGASVPALLLILLLVVPGLDRTGGDKHTGQRHRLALVMAWALIWLALTILGAASSV